MYYILNVYMYIIYVLQAPVGRGDEDGGGGVYANRRESGVLFKANKLKQDIKKYVAVYSAAAVYYIRLSLCKSFRTFVCCIRPLSSSAAARGTNIINSSRLSRGGTPT